MQSSSRPTLMQLFRPAFLENLLVTLVGIIDVVMVSMVGDEAVGAVGTTGTYLTMVSTMLMVMSTGSLTVMTQNIGAGHPETAVKAKNVSIAFNICFGLFFTVIFSCFSGGILSVLSTSDALYDDAVTYMSTVGASCIILAVSFVYSSYLRSFGHANLTLISATAGNIANLVLNWIFIQRGMAVYGIALATVIARLITLSLSFIFSLRIKEGRNIRCSQKSTLLLYDILRIGLPAAGESVAFYLCTSLVIISLNRMDALGIAAGTYSYCNQLTSIINCAAVAIGQSNAVIVGWHMGEGAYGACAKQTSVSSRIGLAASFGVSLICLAFARPLISLLTDSSDILALVIPVMAVNILREIGRSYATVYGMALKASGDALSTLKIGIVVMPVCALFGGYFLGLACGMGITGAWIGIALDEFIRGMLMMRRWKTGKWQQMALVRH